MLSTNETLPMSNEISNETKSIISQLILYFPSDPVVYSVILNIIFGFFLIQQNIKEQGKCDEIGITILKKSKH